jgi:hypothetical protein
MEFTVLKKTDIFSNSVQHALCNFQRKIHANEAIFKLMKNWQSGVW